MPLPNLCCSPDDIISMGRFELRTLTTPCFLPVVGRRDRDGYGMVTIDGTTWRWHRLTWTVLVGQVPDDLDVDHGCREPGCGWPMHCEPVPHSVNLERARDEAVYLAAVAALGLELLPMEATELALFDLPEPKDFTRFAR